MTSGAIWRYIEEYFRHKSGDARYGVKLAATMGLIVGGFLMIEHAIVWGGFDPIWLDPLGHEWLGIYIVLISAATLIWTRYPESTYVKMWREIYAQKNKKIQSK